MKQGWVLFVSRRYLGSGRRARGAASSLLSVLGIAVGTAALLAVLAIMNGFQLGFIEDVLEISSYHIRLTSDHPLDAAELEAIGGVEGVSALVPFRDLQGLVKGSFSTPHGVLLRALPPDALALDPGLAAHVTIDEGAFDLIGRDAAVIGSELALSLGVEIGDTITCLALDGASFEDLEPLTRELVVTGIFQSGYYEFDVGWCFVSLAGAAADGDYSYGIKLSNRFADRDVMQGIFGALQGAASAEAASGGEGVSMESWRDYNRAYFGALRMEKLIASLVVGLIFLLVGVNIFHLLKRSVVERTEEIGLLKAIGAAPRLVRAVFVVEGLLIGFVGSFVGLVAGLWIASHVNQSFAFMETAANFLVDVARVVFAPFPWARNLESVSFFSSSYYYLTEVPSRVLFPEVFLVAIFALASPAVAALFASRRVVQVRPQEVLKYE